MEYVHSIVYGPVDSVGELQGVQSWVGAGFEMGQNKALKIIKSCGPWFFWGRG